NIYIADAQNCRVRMVAAGIITTLAGNGVCADSGDSGPATSASMSYVQDVAVDSSGSNVYIADSSNCRIRKVNGGTITAFAGDGSCTFGGDAGPAASASLSYPTGLALDATGANVYIADTYNCRIRKVSAGTISTLAGNG